MSQEESTDEKDDANVVEVVEVVESRATKYSNGLDYAFESGSSSSKRDEKLLATAHQEQDTEFDRDHRAGREATLTRNKRHAEKGTLETEYHGLKGYQQFLFQGDTTRANAASDKNRIAGPVRAVSNLRTTCRFDYKPDLCKDYNETGFCGFGDSCVFLHDRTEHKSSYQIEKEWQAEQARKASEAQNTDHLVVDKKRARPTTCSVCNQPFTRPVKTRCGHYFCEGCVLKKPQCPNCKSALFGSFVPAAKELA